MKKNILIFRTGQLGDTLVAMPAINEIFKDNPDCQLTLLTDSHPTNKDFVSSWDVLRYFKWFNDVIFYKPQVGKLQTSLELIRLFSKVRALSPIKVYNLSHKRSLFQYWRDKFFFEVILGIKNYYSPNIFNYQARDSENRLPRLQSELLRLLNVTGKDNISNNFRLTIPENAKKEAEKILRINGIKDSDDLIVLCPGSKMPAKKWPTERYTSLALKLFDRYPSYKIVLIGGEGDLSAIKHICHNLKNNMINLCGKLSVCGSAAVLERSLIYIGNDTGAMHLAAMVGTPCVAIFSARDYPGRWEPYGDYHKILRHDIDCSPCFLDICSEHDNKCIKMINVEEVFSAATKLLS